MIAWFGFDYADILSWGWELIGRLIPGMVVFALATGILSLVVRRLYLALLGRPDNVGDGPVVKGRSPGGDR